MIEFFVLFIFSITLITSVILSYQLVYPLLFGLFLFFGYGIYKKHSFSSMCHYIFSGIITVKDILYIFILIGMITASWRSSGTIPFIVYHGTSLISPNLIVVASFLLCGLLSTLIGTSFGTSATLGIICMAISNSLGIPPYISGGAILSGCYLGDRCSPMSTSALLVSNLTHTNIYENIKIMFKTSIVPFILTTILFLLIGFLLNPNDLYLNTQNIFTQNFNLHIITVIPALIIILLSCFKINIKTTMLSSICAAIIISICLQKHSVSFTLITLMKGFISSNTEIAPLLNGGGILSMVNVFLIVLLASTYGGIFEGTGFLENIKMKILILSNKSTKFTTFLFTSILLSLVTCNQTLTIILTHQLCNNIEDDDLVTASYLENTTVLISPLIPWSIACAVPLSTIGAPTSSIFFALYLFLVPLYNLIISFSK